MFGTIKPTRNAASKPLVPIYPSVKNRAPALLVNGSTATSKNEICAENITAAVGI